MNILLRGLMSLSPHPELPWVYGMTPPGSCFLTATVLALLAASTASTSDAALGYPCSTANDRLDSASHKFLSDCDETTFCTGSVNATCQPRQCRRDEFPFGFANFTALPPLCQNGTYCPDEGSGCKPLLAVGATCQMDRDDQCSPPPNWQDIASNQNFNGSLCLKSTCVYANMTLGQACTIDDVTYIDVGPGGEQFSNTVSRHNCVTPQFYCDANLTACVPTKALGAPCASDQECLSFNCAPNGACADPPETPARVEAWQIVLTSLSVITAMVVTVVMLTFVHKRLRLQRYREIREYYEEQMSLRKSLAALHAAAADRYAGQKRWQDQVS
ncbi:hypothetical protein C8Q77DRAFT_1143400 [Trametes polyzona]|nr:hypothetical protein C8Q77DRAFT_1143400 [Trametes polyzona]